MKFLRHHIWIKRLSNYQMIWYLRISQRELFYRTHIIYSSNTFGVHSGVNPQNVHQTPVSVNFYGNRTSEATLKKRKKVEKSNFPKNQTKHGNSKIWGSYGIMLWTMYFEAFSLEIWIWPKFTKNYPSERKIRKYYNKTFFFKHPIKLIFPNFPPIDKN